MTENAQPGTPPRETLLRDQSAIRPVALVYHDGDGSVYPYDRDGNLIEEWPTGWPERIADVQTFCRARGIGYRR